MADKMTSRKKRSPSNKSMDPVLSRDRVITRRSKPAVSRNSPPPVMARSYSVDMPLQNTKVAKKYARRARRRFDIGLPVPGAEIRLPSLPAFAINFRLVVISLLAVLVISFYFLWKSPIFRIDHLEFEGVSPERMSELNTILRVKDTPVLMLNRQELIEKINRAFPEFSSVDIQVGLPNTVTIFLKERVPVLAWRQNNVVNLVDSQGFAFPLRMTAMQVNPPLVEAAGAPPGIAPLPQTTEAIIKKLLSSDEEKDSLNSEFEAAANALEPEADPKLPLMTTDMVNAIRAIAAAVPADVKLQYSPEHGLGWQDSRGWQVYFGSANDVDMKLLVYDAIVNHLSTDGLQAVLISVENVHTPYYRIEQ